MFKRYSIAPVLLLAVCFPIGAQTCKTAIPSSTPTSAFTFHQDGVVTHNQTGLMWKRCLEGQLFDDNGTSDNFSDDQCSGSIGKYTWQSALQRPGSVNSASGYAGHFDWFLPNSKEFGSIVEVQCSSPAINLSVFPNAPSDDQWTSSSYADNPNMARFVRFSYGQDGVNPKNGAYSIRLVRTGSYIVADGDFSAWSFGSAAGTASVSREAAGGSPGVCLNMTTISGTGTAYGIAIKTDVYSTLPLSGIQFELQLDVLSGPGSHDNGQGILLLVQQDSSIYGANLDITSYPRNWDRLSFTGAFTETSFVRLSGSGPTAPDFSGSVQTFFGFSAWNNNSGTMPLTQYYDNFHLEIASAP